MARLVPDASATLTWCFEDEAMPWTDALLAKLRAGDEAIVPANWPAEVANALLIAVRRGCISREKADRFFLDLRALPIRIGSEQLPHPPFSTPDRSLPGAQPSPPPAAGSRA